MITDKFNQNQIKQQKIKILQKSYENKIEQLTILNTKYSDQICNLTKKINKLCKLKEQFQNEKRILEIKMNKYKVAISKYHQFYKDLQFSSLFNHKIVNQKQKEYQQLLSKFIDLKKFNYLKQFEDLQDRGLFAKNQNGLNQSLNNNLINNNSYFSIKSKSITTTLYCQQCKKDYPPNKFYSHLSVHQKYQKKQNYQNKNCYKGNNLQNLSFVKPNSKSNLQKIWEQ